jgi:cell division cycle 2-like protein
MSASADHSDEEGLVRSPDNIDSDEATNDSLDIKPPQAKNEYRSSSRKHKRHEKRSDYYSREKDDRRDQRRDYRDKYDYKRDPRDYSSEKGRKSEQSRSRRSSQDDLSKYDYERREEDLRNRLIERRQQKEAHGSSRRDDYERKSYDDKRHHRHRPIDSEAEARRKKFLEVDRDEMKRKEKARQELEARREQHRSKETKSREVTPSPERKKKRYSSEDRQEQDVVMLSSEQSGHEEVDSELESHSTKSKDSEEFEMSPIPVEQLEKSDRRSRSSSHYTRSRSRSTHSRSRSHSESSTGSSDTAHSGSSKSSDSESDEKQKSPKAEKEPSPPKETAKEEETLKVEKDEELLPPYFPALQGCRSVEEFQCLNRIEEGTYGVVYRAKDKRSDEVVALKRLKMEKEKEGFPITSLREINTLLKGQHPNIVTVREIVVGSNMDKIFIVMDYVEHDLKSLMETMKHKKQVFLPGEVKCLIQQLMRAVAHLHDNWILHRDLKTSNLLLSHKGILKVGDFGLAREYGSPLKEYTSIVVTLWYRAPELLLCCKEYSTSIDVWSCGCIFAELLAMAPLFPGKSEVDQLNRIFKDLGTPNERVWPGYDQLPLVKKMTFTDYPISQLRKKFANYTSELGLSLLQGLLTYDPKQRLTAEASLKSNYFKELPLPIDPSMFPT